MSEAIVTPEQDIIPMDLNSEAAENWTRAMKAESRVEWLEAENERLQEALRRIRQWVDAYPLDIFPEPDWRRAREALKAGGMSLDAVSAGAMRRVIDGIKRIITEDAWHGGE